ncbi:hypothetical protein T031_21640 [Salmonella enterica]|nr:hypothetical protein [Salmonella enterica]
MCSSYSSELLCNASLRLIRSFVCHRRLLRGRPACSLLYECKLPLNCTLCKSTCASLLYEITCDIRKRRRFYAITIEKIAEIAWLYVTARR